MAPSRRRFRPAPCCNPRCLFCAAAHRVNAGPAHSAWSVSAGPRFFTVAPHILRHSALHGAFSSQIPSRAAPVNPRRLFCAAAPCDARDRVMGSRDPVATALSCGAVFQVFCLCLHKNNRFFLAAILAVFYCLRASPVGIGSCGAKRQKRALFCCKKLRRAFALVSCDNVQVAQKNRHL